MGSISEGPNGEGSGTPRDRTVTPELQERLALALEEAAVRVRQSIPDAVEWDVEDDVEMIHVGNGSIPGMRSPLRRIFRIEW